MACSLTLRPICCLDSAINAGAIWAGEVLISGGDLSIADSKASTENGGQGRGRGGEGRGGERGPWTRDHKKTTFSAGSGTFERPAGKSDPAGEDRHIVKMTQRCVRRLASLCVGNAMVWYGILLCCFGNRMRFMHKYVVARHEQFTFAGWSFGCRATRPCVQVPSGRCKW